MGTGLRGEDFDRLRVPPSKFRTLNEWLKRKLKGRKKNGISSFSCTHSASGFMKICFMMFFVTDVFTFDLISVLTRGLGATLVVE